MSILSVLAFQNENEAKQVLDELKKLQDQKLIKVEDAAIVTRDQNGRPKIKQANNLVGAGALGGAFWGLLLGLLFFVPIVGMAVGAGIGAMSGKMADLGINDDFIKQVSSQIKPGQSALFLLTTEAVVDKVVPALKQYQFQVLHTSLSNEDESKLRDALGMQR
jgi:uncharacterized membrane protein